MTDEKKPEERVVEVGMLTVAEAVALRDELLTMRNERRRMRIVRDTPLTDRLINTLIIEIAERTGKIITSPGTITAEQVVQHLTAARAAAQKEAAHDQADPQQTL